MLDVDTTTAFLLERGLIDVASIIQGGLVVRSAARRNRNVRVESSTGEGFLIKQADDSVGGSRRTIGAEARFYSFCNDLDAEALTRILPRVAYFDSEGAVLALELIAGARPLWSHCTVNEPSDFPAEVCDLLGSALATIHRTFSARVLADDPRLAWLHRAEPWVLRAHQPVPEMLASLSAGNYQTLRIVQSQEPLNEQLDRVRSRWQPETVIHGDIRSDNILVQPANRLGRPSLYIIDWELVQVGDPAWDIAGALQDFLLFWTDSMPMSHELTADERAAQARYPLPILQRGIRAFWQGYVLNAGLEHQDAEDRLERAVAFAGVRLIQSSYEMCQELDGLTGQAVLALQISANLLADPELARLQIFGIPRSL